MRRFGPALLLTAFPAQAQEASTEGEIEQTELCTAIMAEADADAATILAVNAEKVRRMDAKCLKANTEHAGAIAVVTTRLADQKAARVAAADAKVPKRGLNLLVEKAQTNLDAVKNRPFDVWILVLNPHEVAVAHKGSATVAFGDIVATLGLMATVDEQVYDRIVEEAQAEFQRRGMSVKVTHAKFQVPESRAVLNPTSHGWTKTTVPQGEYTLVKVHVPHPISVAKAEMGGAAVTVAMASGMVDVEKQVRLTVEQNLYNTLVEKGVDVVLVRLGKAKKEGTLKRIPASQ